MPDDFKLVSPEIIPSGHGGRRPGAGRRRGTINRLRDKLSLGSWKAGAKEHPEILEGILRRAKKLNDPLWTPNKIDAMLAVWCAEHFWQAPRSPAIQLDLRNAGSMQDALEAGDLTPGDYGALVRANSQRLDVIPASGISCGNARDALADKLAKQFEARAHGQNGFHNAPSEDQTGCHAVSPPIQPNAGDTASSAIIPESAAGDLVARVERAVKAAIDGNVDQLTALAGELERE